MQTRLASELLGSAQTHLPALGFTLEAIQAGAQQRGLASPSTVSDLFPSPFQAACGLLERYDADHWVHAAPLRDDSGGSGRNSIDGQHRAYTEAVALVESKLEKTLAVRDKLPDALAALVASPQSRVPNPSPVLRRAYSVADEALHLAGWSGNLSTDWYTTRFILTNSYMLAELHMISPEQQASNDISPSLQLYRRLALRSEKKASGDFPRLDQWASWGAQGWLGILRSHGL